MTLFDFDDCGIGPQLLDAAAIAFWLEVGQQEEPAGLWSAFLQGYEVEPSPSLGRTIRWLALQQQMRIVGFLLDSCEPADDLWIQVFDDTERIADRVATNSLRAHT